MKSRTYYGEYSLKHWIQMLLSKNIILPEYQRSYVWGEADLRRLVKSLSDGQFVQPVTIALYKMEKNMPGQNLIIDGQQRLSSILLAYLGYMPNKKKFEHPEVMASDEDDANDEAPDNQEKGPIKWRFSELLEESSNNTAEEVKNRLSNDERYSKLTIDLREDFFDNSFLGYSYIVPVSADKKVVQSGFSRLFRDINFFGKQLSPLESRRSLYYLNKDLRPFFEGTYNDLDVLCDIRLIENMQPIRIDFVRYLSILSQYSLSKDTSKVLVGYSASSSRESYYADYVSFLLELDQEERENKFDNFSFDETFSKNCWIKRYQNLREAIGRLKPLFGLNNNAFISWIDADYWLFGLIYHVVFEGKSIKEDLENIENSIAKEIVEKKGNEYYSKSPNRLGNVRERLERSILLIVDYVQ